VAEIADAVVEAVPGSTLVITGESGADPRSYRVDFSAARSALGFEAEWTIPAGARELYQNYVVDRLTSDDFEHRFTRLNRLKVLQQDNRLDESMRRVTAAA
jgi:hypothetical protein